MKFSDFAVLFLCVCISFIYTRMLLAVHLLNIFDNHCTDNILWNSWKSLNQNSSHDHMFMFLSVLLKILSRGSKNCEIILNLLVFGPGWGFLTRMSTIIVVQNTGRTTSCHLPSALTKIVMSTTLHTATLTPTHVFRTIWITWRWKAMNISIGNC